MQADQLLHVAGELWAGEAGCRLFWANGGDPAAWLVAQAVGGRRAASVRAASHRASPQARLPIALLPPALSTPPIPTLTPSPTPTPMQCGNRCRSGTSCQRNYWGRRECRAIQCQQGTTLCGDQCRPASWFQSNTVHCGSVRLPLFLLGAVRPRGVNEGLQAVRAHDSPPPCSSATPRPCSAGTRAPPARLAQTVCALPSASPPRSTATVSRSIRRWVSCMRRPEQLSLTATPSLTASLLASPPPGACINPLSDAANCEC